MKYNIVDGMKKEGKAFGYILIVCIVLLVLTFVYMHVNNIGLKDKEMLVMFLGYLMFAILSLYCWLYSLTYRVSIDDNQLLLKTLFRKVKVDICNIERYFCKQYGKSKFFQFDLFANGKKVRIYTRYKEEFENLLKENEIERIIK